MIVNANRATLLKKLNELRAKTVSDHKKLLAKQPKAFQRHKNKVLSDLVTLTILSRKATSQEQLQGIFRRVSKSAYGSSYSVPSFTETASKPGTLAIDQAIAQLTYSNELTVKLASRRDDWIIRLLS